MLSIAVPETTHAVRDDEPRAWYQRWDGVLTRAALQAAAGRVTMERGAGRRQLRIWLPRAQAA